MFLKPDEHMVLFNSNDDIGGYGLRFISHDEEGLRRIKDETGVGVASELVYWHAIEKEMGKYDWSLPDKQVNRCIKAGMRLLLCTPNTVPTCLPDEWYSHTSQGNRYQGILSFWHPDAEAYQQQFLQAMVNRYGCSDVNIVYHGFLSGESYLWNVPVYHDKAATQDYQKRFGIQGSIPEYENNKLDQFMRDWISDAVVSHYLKMHEVLVGQFNEVWDSTQYIIALQSETNGNFARPAVLKAYRERWPEASIWLLQYTYWLNGKENADYVDDLLEKYDCKTIVEANYCEDLARTVEMAVLGGLNEKSPERWHGQIVCPLHPYRGHRKMEPWMYQVIKEANDKWKVSRMRVKEV
jgi:hypothetical protein